MRHRKKGKVGCSFDGFLAEQGILEECEEQAIKQILADQIRAAMEKERLTKAAMAIRMKTSRRALDRLLDPANTSVTLHTLQRAAVARSRRFANGIGLGRVTLVTCNLLWLLPLGRHFRRCGILV